MTRQSDRSTRQMLEADVGSYYVIPSPVNYGYFIDLSERIGRTDLSIINLHSISRVNDVCGIVLHFPVVVDHACGLKDNHLECLEMLEYRFKRTKQSREKRGLYGGWKNEKLN